MIHMMNPLPAILVGGFTVVGLLICLLGWVLVKLTIRGPQSIWLIFGWLWWSALVTWLLLGVLHVAPL